MFLTLNQQLQTGIALKRSRFKDASALHFRKLLLHALNDHHFVVVDYEGEELLLSPSFLESILQEHQGHGVLTLTLAARARELAYNYAAIEAYARLAKQYTRLNFALVAGHPAYASVDVNLSSQKTMTWLAKTLRQLTAATSPLLVGMENLPCKFAAALVQQFQLIPFFLKSEMLEQELAEFQRLVPHWEEYAVYSPIHFTEDVVPFLQQMIGYILRRERSQHQLATMNLSAETVREIVTTNTEVPASLQTFLRQRLNDLTMYGANIQQQCHGLQRSGISIIIGHPSIPHETESVISRLAQVLHS